MVKIEEIEQKDVKIKCVCDCVKIEFVEYSNFDVSTIMCLQNMNTRKVLVIM